MENWHIASDRYLLLFRCKPRRHPGYLAADEIAGTHYRLHSRIPRPRRRLLPHAQVCLSLAVITRD